MILKLSVVLLLITLVLVSGCSQPSQKTSSSPEKSPADSTAPTNTPSATEVSVSGDVLGSELATSDSIDSDLNDANFETASSDLSEIEKGL